MHLTVKTTVIEMIVIHMVVIHSTLTTFKVWQGYLSAHMLESIRRESKSKMLRRARRLVPSLRTAVLIGW